MGLMSLEMFEALKIHKLNVGTTALTSASNLIAMEATFNMVECIGGTVNSPVPSIWWRWDFRIGPYFLAFWDLFGPSDQRVRS